MGSGRTIGAGSIREVGIIRQLRRRSLLLAEM